MSAFHPKADLRSVDFDFCKVPLTTKMRRSKKTRHPERTHRQAALRGPSLSVLFIYSGCLSASLPAPAEQT